MNSQPFLSIFGVSEFKRLIIIAGLLLIPCFGFGQSYRGSIRGMS
jgi:hypothetical protein